MIKVILFDFGGVYLKGSAANFVKRSCKALGIHTPKELPVDYVTFHSGLNLGEMTTEAFVQHYFNRPMTPNQTKKIVDIWASTWKANPHMQKLAHQLKKQYRLGVLSNSDLLNTQNYHKAGAYDPFEQLILSHELGILKPDPKIYRIAIRKFNVKPSEILFIDDQERCLVTARKLGMKTLRFTSFSGFKKDLRTHGIWPTKKIAGK
ncbi:MAG: HAD family phosphatase [Candidatus Diapherotrites archaeon]|uniref:HAD family phosphatase n=1 Tax=Candidatus Iainarchaeum sp. TaxID=3101447 RepID=A0A8T4L5N9_9ARCH|nr:HAD family phosphatase [Candidatus Diapherotrites archaeon]